MSRPALSGIFLAALFALGIASHLFDTDNLVQTNLTTLVSGPDLLSPDTVGEILNGVRIQQHFQLPPDFPAPADGSRACIGLLLATYLDRSNRGSMVIRVQVADKREQHRVDFRDARDNRRYIICLDSIGFEDVAGAGRLDLTIAGEKGRPGRSITAWLTEDTSYGTVSVNNEPMNSSLVLSLHSLEQSHVILFLGAILGALSLVAAAAILGLMRNGNTSP